MSFEGDNLSRDAVIEAEVGSVTSGEADVVQPVLFDAPELFAPDGVTPNPAINWSRVLSYDLSGDPAVIEAGVLGVRFGEGRFTRFKIDSAGSSLTRTFVDYPGSIIPADIPLEDLVYVGKLEEASLAKAEIELTNPLLPQDADRINDIARVSIRLIELITIAEESRAIALSLVDFKNRLGRTRSEIIQGDQIKDAIAVLQADLRHAIKVDHPANAHAISEEMRRLAVRGISAGYENFYSPEAVIKIFGEQGTVYRRDWHSSEGILEEL